MVTMTVYDPAFYDLIREGTRRSAQVVVPLICDALGGVPGRVVDVGCGEGWWALEFARLGSQVVGVDGAYVEGSPLTARFVAHDLDTALPDLGTFDLAISLEVAEHLTPARSEGFVADLCRLAPVVAFSAAYPGQGGVGHLAERWQSYWAAQFMRHGYLVTGCLRGAIWDDDRVECWYRSNLLLAADVEHATGAWLRPDLPLDLVHPITFAHHRGVRYP